MTHHLHTVIVSFNRRSLTEQTLASYLETVTVPHSLVIVDNASEPDVLDWLVNLDVQVLFLDQNRYPGYATNRGWEMMPPRTTLLQRIDNDTRYLPGWCDEMVEAFSDPKVGQYGPTLGPEDLPWTSRPGWPVGGNSVISRAAYDRGLRYSEHPWAPGVPGEDWQLTQDIWAAGFKRVFGKRQGIEYLGGGDPEYYAETRRVRGLSPL